jgi:EAL domain-containing protein (putative c-di-GMP-specific phosphodiesterase class I)
VAARHLLEGQLRRAMERKEFVLFYQPKASLVTGEVTGVEALIRWHAPGRGMVPPDRFIGVLEDSGLILPVGAWVIRTACAEMAAWGMRALEGKPLALSTALVPIMLGERRIGTLGLNDHRHENAFGEAEVRLLTTVAASMGVALENARLFHETQKRAAEMATIAAPPGTSNERVMLHGALIEIDEAIFEAEISMLFAHCALCSKIQLWLNFKD